MFLTQSKSQNIIVIAAALLIVLLNSFNALAQSFSTNESNEDTFSLTAAKPWWLNTSNYVVVNKTTTFTTFVGIQYTGTSVWILDPTNAQRLINGQQFSGYPASNGLGFVTVPAGQWYIGAVYNGTPLGNQTANGYDEIDAVDLPGASFIGNIPMGVGGNKGAWTSRGFTVGGQPTLYIETEGSGGIYMLQNAAQNAAFTAAYANGYTGGQYGYLTGQSIPGGGTPATEIEGSMQLPPGTYYLLWINTTGAWAGGAANIWAYSTSSSSDSLSSAAAPAICTNGATNYPTCNSCPTGQSLQNGTCSAIPAICTNGATNYPACTTCPSGQSLQSGVCAVQKAPVITPASGWWYNPNDVAGRGYSLEVNASGQIFLAAYMYRADGTPVWYIADEVYNAPGFSGTLFDVTGTQTLTSTGAGTTAIGPTSLKISGTFTSSTQGTLTLTGGPLGSTIKTIPITRFAIDGVSIKAPSSSAAPQTGWWYNVNENGVGYFIEQQGTQIFFANYTYSADRSDRWYIALNSVLPVGTSGEIMTGSLLLVTGGQTLTSGPLTTSATTVGQISLQFTSPTSGTLTLPNGRVVSITKFSNF
jgi:archaellum component FlaG (FlaF/FlaG flagellin family)